MSDADLLEQAIKKVKWDTKPEPKGFFIWKWEHADIERVCKIYGDLKAKEEREKILDIIERLKKFSDNADSYIDKDGKEKDMCLEVWDGIYTFYNGLKKELGAKK